LDAGGVDVLLVGLGFWGGISIEWILIFLSWGVVLPLLLGLSFIFLNIKVNKRL
jgi:hypothetical protein